MKVKVLVYAYATGVFSSRKIAKKLEEDVVFWALAGGNFPAHRTICDFRHDHLEEFGKLLVQMVQMARESGMVQDAGIDAVFSTDRARTRETAAPVAAAAGLSPQLYTSAAEVAGAIREQSGGDAAGDTFLVVGHSNTLDDVAASLGVTGLSNLDESEYDRLYLIHLYPSEAFLERLRFGAPSPVDGQRTEP